jgi:predicted ATP-grasp superfamily ATP-dependent carboligase
VSARVLIAGVSTRAAAESAARAGFQVTAIDAFADLDQHPSVRALSLPRDFGRRFSSTAAAWAGRSVSCDAVAYLSSFENHRRAVTSLAAGRALWGNPADVLRHVRDPLALSAQLRERGFVTPRVSRSAADVGVDVGEEWLVKPLASGGGQGVRPWRGRISGRCYLQELVPGTPGSVTFVAAAGHAVTLGISRQLVGDPAFGAQGYRYCGSILMGASELGASPGRELVSRAGELASVAAAEFDLVGVNGVDFVARGSEPVPIEVNPRWCASMELVERAHGLSVFDAHAGACRSRELPSFDFAAEARSAHAAGKAIVFARDAVVIGDTRPWLDDPTVRDVPYPGERFAAGHPVCTVFGNGRTTDDCYRALIERADRVYAELATWQRAVA